MTNEIARHELREGAVLAERCAENFVDLTALWQELTSGQARIVDSFVAERCYVVVKQPSVAEARAPLNDRQRSILEALLCGCDNKTVAYDFGVAQSTVSQTARQALQQMGADCPPGRACPMLSLAAQASSRQNGQRGRAGTFDHAGRTYRVVGAARPDDPLAKILPPAEYAVVRGLLDGQPYVEIARKRGTSTRTVANQIAAAFRRIGVSGRGSLLHHLITSKNVQLRSA